MQTLKEQIHAAGTSFGVAMIGNSPSLVEIAARSGANFIWLDVEHGPADWQTVEHLCRAIELHKAWPLVRVPSGERQSVLRALEVGGRIIVTPMINTAADAARVVEYGKFPPLGWRGFNTGSRGVGYGFNPPLECLAAANAGTVLLVQIETMQAVENLDAIVSVPGLDGILIGPGDLSQTMGIPAQWDNPKLLGTIDHVFRTAQKRGLVTAAACATPDQIKRWKGLGVNLLNVGSDLGLIRKGVTELLETCRQM
jgi:4-hydroxy-2-oxoheptanedioate aldolase